ncbi:MAG: hypothetical protein AB1679_18755 [Actinomycetota bacterium]
MNALANFQAALPSWRPAVEAWLERLPATIRTHPSRAALAYLFTSPALQAIDAELYTDLEAGRIDWPGLEHRASEAGDVERVLVHAAKHLVDDDPGPALGLMLLFPHIEAFHWAHSAGTIHALLEERLNRHALSPR